MIVENVPVAPHVAISFRCNSLFLTNKHALPQCLRGWDIWPKRELVATSELPDLLLHGIGSVRNLRMLQETHRRSHRVR